MRSYIVRFHYRSDLEGMTNKEKFATEPNERRVGDSDSRRATNQVINNLKAESHIRSGRDIIVVEVVQG